MAARAVGATVEFATADKQKGFASGRRGSQFHLWPVRGRADPHEPVVGATRRQKLIHPASWPKKIQATFERRKLSVVA
jgi:hypothetical protein